LKYESALKKWDAELYSVVGAAGEFAIRTALYKHVEKDTILDDFIISLRVAQEGYTIQYDPEAYAIETASANVKEEFKRKIRISAGIQSIVRLRSLLNILNMEHFHFSTFLIVFLMEFNTFVSYPLNPVLTILSANEGLFFWFYSILFCCKYFLFSCTIRMVS
jgi:cellulose synthase/poly-beta-1,6-N-acetylglucosamine synthase-like glycosyltransferase